MTDKKITINPLYGALLFLITGLALLVCKLTAYPSISWWWVVGIGLAPLWIVLTFVSVLVLVFLSVFLVAFLFDKKNKR